MVNPEYEAALAYARLRSAQCQRQSLAAPHNDSPEIQSIDGKTRQLPSVAYTKSAKKSPTQPLTPSTQQQEIPSQPPINFNERPTLIVLPEEDCPSETQTPPEDAFPLPPTPTSPEPESTVSFSEDISTSLNFPPSLNLQSQYPSASPEFLATLPPKQLWQELLTRMISQGIGRLYFEPHADWGRILWINNGVLQLSLDKLAPETFYGVIRELKQLAQLPPEFVSKPQQGELMRVYQQEQILLRWRVSSNKQGEEGTIQVLRGKALEFYQQRQMDDLGEQAVRLAQTLERKLQEIRALAKSNPANLQVLPTLRQVQEKIRQQLEALDHL